MVNERRDGNGRRQVDDLPTRLGNVETRQGRVIDLLMGPEELQMDGTMKRKTEEGMNHKVNFMYERERDGGLHVRLTGRDRALVVAAFFAAVGAVTAALVGS